MSERGKEEMRKLVLGENLRTVELARKLVARRNEMRRLLGDRYDGKVGKYRDVLRGMMAAHGCNEFEAYAKASEELKEKFGDSVDIRDELQLFVCAAVDLVLE